MEMTSAFDRFGGALKVHPSINFFSTIYIPQFLPPSLYIQVSEFVHFIDSVSGFCYLFMYVTPFKISKASRAASLLPGRAMRSRDGRESKFL